jgi:O-antigen/teichoic acid export membrane protein
MSRLSKNIIYNLFGQVLMLLLGFVSIKYIFGRLGEDALGIIYFTAMVNSLLRAALEMGICSTTVREVSAHLDSEPDYIHDLIRTGSFFYWGAYALLGVAIYFLAPILVEKWINLKTMDTATAIYVLRFLGIASLVALPQSFYNSVFSGLQRMEFNNLIDVAAGCLRQFGTILILALGANLFHVVYWFTACYSFSIFAYLTVSARFFPVRALIPGYSSIVIKRNISFASIMTLQTIIGTIIMQVDKVIISKLMPVGMIGYYSVAYGSVSKGLLITGSITQAAYPSFSALFGAGETKSLMAQYRKLQDLICFVTVPIFAIIPFALLPLFSYILNHEVAQMLLLPTTLLCLGFYLNSTLRLPHRLAVAVGKPEIAVKTNSCALFTVTPATIPLIYFLGLTGAGLSWVLYNIFNYTYAIPRICSECLKIPVKHLYWHVLRFLMLAILTYGVAWYTLSAANNNSVISLGTAYLAATIVYLISGYIMIGEELKGAIFNHMQEIKTRILGLHK